MEIGTGTVIGLLMRMRHWVCKWLCGTDYERTLAQERQRRLNSLVEEVRENLAVTRHPTLAGGLSLRRFRLAAWDGASGDSQAYPVATRDTLREVYVGLRACNKLADDFEIHRDGRLKVVFTREADSLQPKLEELEQALQGIHFSA